MRLRELLFERGQGWLRWGYESREFYEFDWNAMASYPVPYTVAPPLRRLWLFVRQVLAIPRLMLVGYKADDMEKRYRFSWEEAQPIWPSYLRDPERGR